MRRFLLIAAALAFIAWAQFSLYPGHSYLAGDTGMLAPQLERLANPGLLSRDLVATHPSLTYTAYDEATLALTRFFPRMDLRFSLIVQQLVFRLAALLGIFLLARAAGLEDLWCLLTAACVNLIGTLPGSDAAVLELEPLPRAFAFGSALLAAGLFAGGKPLLAGLAGGMALIYDLRIAAPFWLLLLIALISDRRLRQQVRPSVTILIVFLLLLANLAQLQPATAEVQAVFDTIPPAIRAVQHFRLPSLAVSAWQPREWLLYACISLLGTWALSSVWNRLNEASRWLLAGLPAMGIVSVPLSYLSLQVLHLRLGAELQPTRILVFTAATGSVSCWIAARFHRSRGRWLFLASPALLLIATYPPPRTSQATLESTRPLADWASANTWGGSTFLFADSGRGLAPSQFRAQALRAVWVDWPSGKLCAYSDSFADEWQRRWRDTLQNGYSIDQLRRLLSLPIDYYVLSPGNAVPHAKPVLSSPQWLVYDAHDLRTQFPPAPMATSY